MLRKFTVFAVAVLAASFVWAEANYQVVSVTNTSAYTRLTAAASSVLICNNSASANIMYFRLFEEGDTLGVATTSSSPIAIGACKSFSNSGGRRFLVLAMISAGTSTAEIDSH